MSSGQKGVMLCERPGPSQVDTSPATKPFLPSSMPSGLEPLGLVPSHKTYPPSLAPKPENINLKTIAAVRDLEQEKKLEALRAEEKRIAEAVKAENVTAFGSQLRQAILSGEDVSFWKASKKADAIRQSVEASKARSAADRGSSGASPSRLAAADGATTSDMASFVDDLVKEAAGALTAAAKPPPPPVTRSDGTADASTSGVAAAAGTPRAGSAGSGQRGRAGAAAGGGGKAASSKPAWALTAEEVAKLEDAEEEELLKFADDLDFDSFLAALDDPDLQESAKALAGEDGKPATGPPDEKAAALRRNLVKAMNHAAMKRVAAAAGRRAAGGEGDDGDAASVAAVSEGGASRATAASRLRSEAAAAKRTALGEGGGAGGGWDGSSRAADDVARMERAKVAQQEAFEFLRENPELRAVHSPASVRAMINRTDGATGKAS